VEVGTKQIQSFGGILFVYVHNKTLFIKCV
jgi:hypothetical protein